MWCARKRTILLIMVLFSCVSYTESALGASLSLKTAQQTYKPGDVVLITADLHNNYDKAVDIVLQCLLTSKTKRYPEVPIPVVVSMGESESRVITLFEMNVTQDFPSDQYRVVVNLLIDGTSMGEREITFLVQDTLKEIQFGARLCEDQECMHESRVFIKNKSIYATYDSSVDGVRVDGEIYFNDMSRISSDLPAIFQLGETGSYVLVITAEKEGFKTETRELNFAIIEREYYLAKEVAIDIKPGSNVNSINLSSQGLVPVAILSSSGFDATRILIESLTFAGATVARTGEQQKAMAHREDVNFDGLVDLVVQVPTRNLNLSELQDRYAILRGITGDGELIQGRDKISLVPRLK
jgi:hypothetical protein